MEELKSTEKEATQKEQKDNSTSWHTVFANKF